MSNIIRNDRGGVYAVNASGHLVTIACRLSDKEIDDGKLPDLKAGMRFATDEDVALVEKIEAERAAKEAKAAKSSAPLAGGV